MKILIASDIHGNRESMEDVLRAYESEGCKKLLLLGDLLYHGPRNSLPDTYDPRAVIGLLNGNKEKILAVRGNCDTEVDQMVLEFPILADYAFISVDGIRIFATHGHRFNTATPPSLAEGEVLLHGHTHVPCAIEFGKKNVYLNPGSAAMPKENYPRTYMVYESKRFVVKSFDGDVILEYKI